MSDEEKIIEQLKKTKLEEEEKAIAVEVREVLKRIPEPEAEPEVVTFGGYTYILDDQGFFVPPYVMEAYYPRFVAQIHKKEGNFNPDVWKKDASMKPACIAWNYDTQKPDLDSVPEEASEEMQKLE
ncbi:hypothetical protein L596_022732 [Steinernema carpocapsae]|uniref:Uncharacterized protein n=1 Tax=Steinernema carpocapsae TaxID=34508 RepID=A0A4U5MML9_STECR|nr:hypothetical protein L596_022732 [Steinernema carpocapsae]